MYLVPVNIKSFQRIKRFNINNDYITIQYFCHYFSFFLFFFFFFFRNRSLFAETLDYQNDGAFDVTVYVLLSESELPSRTVFFCELIIPNTPYNVTKRYVYSPGKNFRKFIKKNKIYIGTYINFNLLMR